jgi:hypothetical protein
MYEQEVVVKVLPLTKKVLVDKTALQMVEMGERVDMFF